MTLRFAGPTTIEAALAILASDKASRPIAGGTDLVVAARQGRKPLPESIVAIDRIAELEGHEVVDGALVLGSLASHAWIADSAEVRSTWSALADASSIVGSPATRATGTIGGNLMNASPAADTTAPLVVLDANLMLRAFGRGSRIVPAANLATAPGQTLVAADELLTTVVVPAPPPGSGSAYVRLEYRRSMEIAVVGAAALVTLAADGSIAAARIALTAVAPTIVRAPEAEAVLVGAAADPETFRAAGEAAAAAASPIDDVRASADYRRAMIVVVVARTLAAAAARARGVSIPVPASRWAHGQEI
ncbi:MAG TPA: FAD binding domain-containing protein [Candidatus Limnocylindrales bacterium]|nr:FAD binding domain-containing protein [Candidatus Limnocylindrales bacterium]